MSLRLYMDHHVDGRVTKGLRQRGIDVLTSLEDQTNEFPDPMLLDRATQLGRVLVSQDAHLIHEARRRMTTGIQFAGLVYGFQLSGSIGRTIFDLEMICEILKSSEIENRIEYLPL